MSVLRESAQTIEPLDHAQLCQLIQKVISGQLVDFSPILQNQNLKEFLQLESHHIVSVYAEKGGNDGFVVYVDNKSTGIKTSVATVVVNGSMLEVIMDICCYTFICPEHFSGVVYPGFGTPRILQRVVKELQEAQLAPLLPKLKYPHMNASLRVSHSIGFH